MPVEFDKEVLRRRIAETRQGQGLNQVQLASSSGVTPAAISQIEKGHRTPTIPVLRRIAKVLGVSLDYLTGKTNQSKIRDMLEDPEVMAFYRGFQSLHPDDKELIQKQIDFLKSKSRARGKR
jgi:transcriptional regulator with XRE-family HTH domain